MSTYDLVEDYAKYYLNVFNTRTMETNEEEIISWLIDFKNILVNGEDQIVQHILKYAPDRYIELKQEKDNEDNLY